MDSPMEFWGVEVKVGQNVKVDPMDPVSAYIHISQVALGEAKKEKANEPVVVYLKVGDQKIVLGTLKKDDIPHLSLDLVLDSDSELSHSSKSASVFFCGYKVLTDDGNISDFSDSEEEEEALPLKGQDNGKPVTKAEGAKVTKPSKPASVKGASVKQIKTVDPRKEDDSDSDESDDELAGNDESDSDEMDDGSDSDEESESEEETPAKKGKKRQNESASKTPISSKKAKTATPEKTDGKKSVHVATPYPMKKGGKTPKNVTKVQSPTSAGQLSCGSCKKNFANEDGLQQHKKAKHGGQ